MTALRAIRILHTAVWGFFAGCILAIPVFAALDRFATAAVLIGVVFVEVAILLLNGLRCPLTTVAEKHTDDRRDNFDIYLPLWLARHNKTIFGLLYAGGALFTLFRWLGRA